MCLCVKTKACNFCKLKSTGKRPGVSGLTVTALKTMLRAQIEGLQLGIVQEGVKRTPLLLARQ